jgi:hypothetical protein
MGEDQLSTFRPVSYHILRAEAVALNAPPLAHRDYFSRLGECLLSGVSGRFFMQPNMPANDPERTFALPNPGTGETS